MEGEEDRKYILLRRDEEYDIFTDGFYIYAGILEKGKMVFGKYIQDFQIDISSKERNLLRKKTSEMRKLNPVRVYGIGEWTRDIQEWEIGGYSFFYGTIDLRDVDGKKVAANKFLKITDENKVKFERVRDTVRELERLFKERDRLLKELEKEGIILDNKAVIKMMIK